MIVREAKFEERPQIIDLGFLYWADGRSLEAFTKVIYDGDKRECRKWFVLVTDDTEQRLLSSLSIQPLNGGSFFGFGNVVTPKSEQKKGYASKLIKAVMERYQEEQGANAFFLYSEVDPKVYERLGFSVLPEVHQKFLSKKSYYMGASDNLNKILEDPTFSVPEFYF